MCTDCIAYAWQKIMNPYKIYIQANRHRPFVSGIFARDRRHQTEIARCSAVSVDFKGS